MTTKTDLSKTSGSSPPTARDTVIVSPETFTAYRDAMKAFRDTHGNTPSHQRPVEREAYIAAIAKVRADVLGTAYKPGVTVECPPGTRAIYLEREGFTAYWAAVNAFKAEHGSRIGDPTQQEDFIALKKSLLGGRYFTGCMVRLHDPDKQAKSEQAKFAPHKASPELIALRRKVRGVTRWLVETFPDCFFFAAKRPLKVGIVGDILERYSMTHEEAYLLREAVGAYRLSPEYRRAYVLGAERINLSGKVVAIVGDEDEDQLNDRLRADLKSQRDAERTA